VPSTIECTFVPSGATKVGWGFSLLSLALFAFILLPYSKNTASNPKK